MRNANRTTPYAEHQGMSFDGAVFISTQNGPRILPVRWIVESQCLVCRESQEYPPTIVSQHLTRLGTVLRVWTVEKIGLGCGHDPCLIGSKTFKVTAPCASITPDIDQIPDPTTGCAQGWGSEMGSVIDFRDRPQEEP